MSQQMIQEEQLIYLEQERWCREEELVSLEQGGINQSCIVDRYETYKLKQKEAARREMEEVEPKTRKAKKRHKKYPFTGWIGVGQYNSTPSLR